MTTKPSGEGVRKGKKSAVEGGVLLPTYERKSTVALNVLKIAAVQRNNSGSDRASSERNENVKGEFLNFPFLITFFSRKACNDGRTILPIFLRWSNQTKICNQVPSKRLFSGSLSPSQQFMNDNGATSKQKWARENFLGEAAGTEVIDVNRSIQNGETNCFGRHPARQPHYTSL